MTESGDETQLGGGTAPGGRRVVSARNLAECWWPHIDLPIPESTAPLAPDVVRAGYAMGRISETFDSLTRTLTRMCRGSGT